MELENIRIFAAAADSGSFSKAAAQLYISHSTVSRAVAALETELGCGLFLRDSRGVTLTPAGEELLLGGRELLALADELVTRVEEREGEKICEDKESW